jgi:S-DNA-T family DNA segregation ATPase FtsK/SpoIIIE
MRRMRISRLQALALCLSMCGLATFGVWHVAAASAAPVAGAVSSQCQALPAPSASASPTPSASSSPSASPSPTAAASSAPAVDLCVSVQASADSFQQGQNATWTVQVWEQNGPVTGVTVTLADTLAGIQADFTGRCPGGDGNSSCTVGDVGTSVTASSDQMDAQVTIPSATAAGTSVSLTATANATPSLPVQPSAGTAVSVTAAPSPSASASATKSAAASSSAATTGTSNAPGVGTIPALAAPQNPTSQVTAVSNPGSIGSLLPVITPAAYSTSPTGGFVSAPAAAPAADPGATAQATSAGSFVVIVPAADAEKIGLAILLLAVGAALGLRAKDGRIFRVFAGSAPRGAHHSGSSATRPKPSASEPSASEPSASEPTASEPTASESSASDEAGDSPK